MALVSGRTIDWMDRKFAPARLAASGQHGAEVRLAPDAPAVPIPMPKWRAPLEAALKRELDSWPGVFIEHKPLSLAVHFRAVPEFGDAVMERVMALGRGLDDRVQFLHGRYVIEVREAGHHKGTAVATLMNTAVVRRPHAGLPRRRRHRRGWLHRGARHGRHRHRRRPARHRPGRFPHERTDPGAGLARRSARATRKGGLVSADLNLAAIGNGTIAALIDGSGRISWCCWPRIDGDPIFSALIGGDEPEAGFFDVVLDGQVKATRRYVENTAIIETVLENDQGAKLRITDFAPRFKLYDRIYRPSMLVRRIEPLSGMCRVTVRLRPHFKWGASRPAPVRGSNHMRFAGEDFALRATTDLPIVYIAEERPFVLSRSATLVLGPDEPFASGPHRDHPRLRGEDPRILVRMGALPLHSL